MNRTINATHAGICHDATRNRPVSLAVASAKPQKQPRKHGAVVDSYSKNTEDSSHPGDERHSDWAEDLWLFLKANFGVANDAFEIVDLRLVESRELLATGKDIGQREILHASLHI